jgi:hypothetical protein
MSATPRHVPGQDKDPLVARVEALERSLAAVANKTLYSASIGRGGITINGTGGIDVTNGVGSQFFVGGGSSAAHHADGSPQIVTIIGDELGRDRLVLWDPANPSSTSNQQIYEYDAFGNITRTQDVNGGWATPWFNVPMYPRFTPPQNATDTNGTVYAYATVNTAVSGIAQGQQLWEGRIPTVSHPRIAIDGTWGQASGTVVPTYKLAVGGTVVGTFSPAFTTSAQGPWDISAFLGQIQVPVTLTVTWTGSGAIAADVLGCYLRQT